MLMRGTSAASTTPRPPKNYDADHHPGSPADDNNNPMPRHLTDHRCAFRALIAAVATLLIGAADVAALEFKAAFRDRSGAHLLSGMGDGIYAPQPSGPPKRVIAFHTAAGRAFLWPKEPTGLAHWQSEWFVADGTTQIAHFREDGTFAGFLDLPARASFLTTCGPALYFVNPVARRPSERIFRTVDGKTFSPLPLSPGEVDERFPNLSHNLLVIAGSADGSLYYIPVFGQPVLRRVLPAGSEKAFPIAYSRTKFRASLDEVIGEVGDATKYSLPARDLLAMDGGAVVVLRNHEDVRGASGRIESIKGMHADLYDRAGRHLASATFSQPVRLLVASGKEFVSGTTLEGGLVTARWGKPMEGEILR